MVRYGVRILLLSLFLFNLAGCGDSSGGETPRVDSPKVKVKAITPRQGPSEDGGATPKVFTR